jgi:hypothetical protein
MNYQRIVEHLIKAGYNVSLDGNSNPKQLKVRYDFDGKTLNLFHILDEELSSLPIFLMENIGDFGNVAHVSPVNNSDIGYVCVSDQDSISVNYERPELAFQESLKRHIDLLVKAISDSKWNEQELIREFYSNWLAICAESGTELICAANGDFEEIKVFSPVPKRSGGFEGKYLGITDSASKLAEFSYIARQGENRQQAGDGFVFPLTGLMPAPEKMEELAAWYLRIIANNEAPEKYTQKRSQRFWLIFNAETPSGKTWFGLTLQYQGKAKKTLPLTEDRLKNWSISAIRVKIFNKERLMSRSGAHLGLDGKSALLVGCGSVGGEIAYKLGAAGIGKLVLSDPDVYGIDNIYRHVLQDYYIGCNKASALRVSLDSKYPWIETKYDNKKLLELRNKDYLNSFDIIIIAIGAPTHERLFHDFLVDNVISTPTVNTWLEGYGIGGHAILDVRNSHGCLRCAYVNTETGERGLASNLNFLQPNQDLTINHAGCGDLFLPYNAVSAAQTALIASNLAIDSLLGKIRTSSKVSWKGDDSEVVSRGFAVSPRYVAFNKSLQLLPLYNEECDLCHE